MFGINQGSMNSFQIMNILNNNQMMKYMTYTLIQNPLMMNQMINILNALNFNRMLMLEIKNLIDQEMNMMNMMNLQKMMMNQITGNMGHNKEFNELKSDELINISFRKGTSRFTIVCNENEKVSDAIQKYRDKYNDYDFEEKFIYNAQLMKPSLTLKEQDLRNGSVIQIETTRDVIP